jgi:adenosylcobinamide-phosphate synthase
MSISNLEIALAALIVEAAVGYPQIVYRAIGHPVTWAGALIAGLERRWNDPRSPAWRRRALGVALLGLLLAVCLALAPAFGWIGRSGLPGAIVCVLVSSSLIAQRSLYQHVRAVERALRNEGLEAGRKAVAMIVGRNPDYLDEAGVARAAIESLAENFSDGVVAPTFWLALAGVPAAMAYKMVNTADSMIGHRSPRYEAFGWAAARFDDLINLPASRLSAIFLIVAAPFVGASPGGALRAVWRDASKHRSPNAGWPEAAMAGACGLSLAGPRVYGNTEIQDATMGAGRRSATSDDIGRALRLYTAACCCQWIALAACWLIWRW